MNDPLLQILSASEILLRNINELTKLSRFHSGEGVSNYTDLVMLLNTCTNNLTMTNLACDAHGLERILNNTKMFIKYRVRTRNQKILSRYIHHNLDQFNSFFLNFFSNFCSEKYVLSYKLYLPVTKNRKTRHTPFVLNKCDYANISVIRCSFPFRQHVTALLTIELPCYQSRDPLNTFKLQILVLVALITCNTCINWQSKCSNYNMSIPSRLIIHFKEATLIVTLHCEFCSKNLQFNLFGEKSKKASRLALNHQIYFYKLQTQPSFNNFLKVVRSVTINQKELDDWYSPEFSDFSKYYKESDIFCDKLEKLKIYTSLADYITDHLFHCENRWVYSNDHHLLDR